MGPVFYCSTTIVFVVNRSMLTFGYRMQKEDWLKVARWTGYVFAPLTLLVLGLFLLALY